MYQGIFNNVTYERRVQIYEKMDMTRSDAQGCADVEIMKLTKSPEYQVVLAAMDQIEKMKFGKNMDLYLMHMNVLAYEAAQRANAAACVGAPRLDFIKELVNRHESLVASGDEAGVAAFVAALSQDVVKVKYCNDWSAEDDQSGLDQYRSFKLELVNNTSRHASVQIVGRIKKLNAPGSYLEYSFQTCALGSDIWFDVEMTAASEYKAVASFIALFVK